MMNGMNPITHKFVCFTDKFAVKRGQWFGVGNPICPHCQIVMTNIGTRIPIPKKRNVKAWNKLRKQFNV